jgi:hypothetical protein
MIDLTNIPSNFTFVSLEKVDATKNPVSAPTPWEEWILGSLKNQASLPISYTLKGYLVNPVRLGRPIQVLRIERNGVKKLGIFCSTPVVELGDHGVVETYNSIYRVSYEANPRKEAK